MPTLSNKAYEALLRTAKEAANHLYTQQDMSRVRELAVDALKRVGDLKEEKPEITRAQLPEELVDSLIDSNFNPQTWADGYTYSSLQRQYGQKLIDATYRLVINPMKKERAQHEAALATITAKYKK